MSTQRVPGGVVHELPADLRKSLLANPAALAAWNDITPLARNEFICWVDDAKQQKTPDNVHTFVGNNKILSGTIQNFSTNSVRRVDLVAQLHHTVDVNDAIRRLKTALAAIPNVAKDPAPDVAILSFTDLGPVLAVRPYTHTDHYWQVYFEANKAIVAVNGEGKYPAPERRLHVRNAPTATA